MKSPLSLPMIAAIVAAFHCAATGVMANPMDRLIRSFFSSAQSGPGPVDPTRLDGRLRKLYNGGAVPGGGIRIEKWTHSSSPNHLGGLAVGKDNAYMTLSCYPKEGGAREQEVFDVSRR